MQAKAHLGKPLGVIVESYTMNLVSRAAGDHTIRGSLGDYLLVSYREAVKEFA